MVSGCSGGPNCIATLQPWWKDVPLCCAALCRTSPQIATWGSTCWQGHGTRIVRHVQPTA